uniref:Peptidase A1 domain-containing protein n=1 Tax=Caenorhabditis tropicalis TaxID=1561998 RepID=A0A1I7V499_9PELO
MVQAHFLLISILFFGFCHAGIFQHPLIFRESLKKRNGLALLPQDVKDFGDSEYIGIITIGRPYQTFKVAIQTGTSSLWIPAPEADSSCNGKTHFYPKTSDTFRVTGRNFDLTYGMGTMFQDRVSGYMGQDLVTFGAYEEAQLKIPNSLFGLALTISNRFSNDTNIDGILGLAPAMNYDRVYLSPLLNAIKQGLLDYSLFSVYLETHGSETNVPGGMFTYGGIDIDHCGPIIDWLPFVSDTNYGFMIDGVAIGNYNYTRKMQVMTDTGTPYIAAPFYVLQGIVATLGAKYDNTTLSYYVDCDSVNLTLDIVIGTKKYSVEPKNYVIDVSALY